MAPFGVRVVLIEPGFYQTDIWGKRVKLGLGFKAIVPWNWLERIVISRYKD